MSANIPSRRRVLHGALALGCGIWTPILFSGCDAKKSADSPGAPSASPASSPAGAPSGSSAEFKKVPQASVQYQTKPKGEQKCGSCLNFIAESNTCKLVDGQVSPEGWCTLWAKKA